MKRLILFFVVLFGMAVGIQAQVFQVVDEGGHYMNKYDVADVDSISYNGVKKVITIHLNNGEKVTISQELFKHRIICYDPTRSILSKLREKGNYTYFLRLVEEVNEWDYGLISKLEGATDLTVFAADDVGWQLFFEENAKLPEGNPWHNATSYENLSQAQKKLLVHASMLNEAIAAKDLSTGRFDSFYIPGEYMRRYTEVLVTDSITKLGPDELPTSYNYYYYPSGTDKDYWERFRAERGGNGIYLATDSTVPMMIHFTAEHMARNNFRDKGPDDFAKIMGHSRNPNDIYINETLLKQTDIVCENGFVHVPEKPLRPLPNMADVIRTNGKTNVFSHILDRFSAPFYCAEITQAYRDVCSDFGVKDSIFIKRYFSDNNYSVKAGYVKADANGAIPKFEPGPDSNHLYQQYNPYQNNATTEILGLKYDPGWNGYYDETNVRTDMAAIFVPSDEQMWWYFTEGSGQRLLKVYYAKEGEPGAVEWVAPTKGDNEELFKQIDCIPIGVIVKLINNFMHRSFVNSIPSKWNWLTDDAMEPLFEDVDVARDQDLDTCLLASNGAIYVMNRTCVPADYRSVTAPANISKVSKIMRSAIYGEYMNLNYYAYLKAMQSRFTFLLPTDDALSYYYDPASMKSKTPRVIEFYFAGGNFPVKLRFRNYTGPYNKKDGEDVGTIGKQIAGTSLYTNDEVTNRLKDILESHTIVHDGTNPMAHVEEKNNKLPTQEYYGIPTTDPLPEYYLSKNGNAVKVERGLDEKGNEVITSVKGGFQLENERQGVTSSEYGITFCQITETNKTDNGYTFVLDAPLVPTYRSVYSIFTNDKDMENRIPDVGGETPYSEFYNLCKADAYETEIIGCGLVDEKTYNTASKRESALKNYKIFIADNGLDYNVQFFNNYRYTIFVPTNEAVQEAVAAGLPTWEDIFVDYHTHCKIDLDDEGNPRVDDEGDLVYTNELETLEDSIRIAAKITYLTNFVRYHFADNSVFADKTELSPSEMVTSSYDKELELFCKIHVERKYNGFGADLRVCDDVTWKENGNSMAGAFVTVGEKNVLARDISCSASPVNRAMKGIIINVSSNAVIHSIPGCMNHVPLDAYGRHDSIWKDIQSARKYLKRYAIQ